jgi:hypothetical protein
MTMNAQAPAQKCQAHKGKGLRYCHEFVRTGYLLPFVQLTRNYHGTLHFPKDFIDVDVAVNQMSTPKIGAKYRPKQADHSSRVFPVFPGRNGHWRSATFPT